MNQIVREIGQVKLVQVQPNGLFVDGTGTDFESIYEPAGLVEVEQLTITSLGIEATTSAGEHVLDIHHISHPGKEYDIDDLVSIGFTSHYSAMRARFGDHMVDGIAGENIIIDYAQEIWVPDLGQKIGIENSETGEMGVLKLQRHASPCLGFSHFAMGSREVKRPAAEIKQALQFLANGRRGFLLTLPEGQPPLQVQAGDRVFVLDA